ncbi:MAG: maleylacetate reductase, partial [Actinomycetota bacterium]|nr:maleylacetate reductase [Actinomycetota bacterium]
MSDAWTHTGYAQQVLFGAGVVQKLPDVVRQLGVRRVLFVTTEGRAESADGAAVRQLLGRALASTFAGVQSHVPA